MAFELINGQTLQGFWRRDAINRVCTKQIDCAIFHRHSTGSGIVGLIAPFFIYARSRSSTLPGNSQTPQRRCSKTSLQSRNYSCNIKSLSCYVIRNWISVFFFVSHYIATLTNIDDPILLGFNFRCLLNCAPSMVAL